LVGLLSRNNKSTRYAANLQTAQTPDSVIAPISDKDTTRAMALLRASVRQSWRPFWEEPRKTAMTAAAVALLALAGPLVIDVLMGTWGKKA
jgi:P2-related tail formation protein